MQCLGFQCVFVALMQTLNATAGIEDDSNPLALLVEDWRFALACARS